MKLRSLTVSFCILAAGFAAAAQEQEPCRDFYFRVGSDPMFMVSNPAAISAFKGHISMAELSFRKDDGAFLSLEDSPDSYRAAAHTESYISISDRISFRGRLSWSYFSGDKMGGPVLMEPIYNPVSFLESNTLTLGRKNKETYSLLGAASYRFSDKWSAGISLDYVSADQTKIKDPRFSNVWMDMNLKAGVSFRPSDSLMLGLTLLYRNTIEQVRSGIYGTTDKQYFIYADKGGFLGTIAELTGDYNYISLTNPRPMQNDFFGLGLQFAGCGIVNELDVLYRKGTWGGKASSTAIFFEFSGLEASYRGKFVKRRGDALHKLSLDIDYELLGNNENVFSYVTPVGQNTRVEYSGQNHISDRHLASAGLSYVFSKGMERYMPDFTAGASLSGSMLASSAVLYPFTRNSDTESFKAEVFADKSFYSGRSVFTISFSGSFRTGFGTPKEDATLVPGASSGYISFDDYLYRQFEYDTASAAGARAGFRYSYVVSARLIPYIELSDSFSAMLQAPQYLGGRFRNTALITLGCNF